MLSVGTEWQKNVTCTRYEQRLRNRMWGALFTTSIPCVGIAIALVATPAFLSARMEAVASYSTIQIIICKAANQDIFGRTLGKDQ